MDKQSLQQVKCPVCRNYMRANTKEHGFIGKCPVCKTLVIERQKSQRETLIRILKN